MAITNEFWLWPLQFGHRNERRNEHHFLFVPPFLFLSPWLSWTFGIGTQPWDWPRQSSTFPCGHAGRNGDVWPGREMSYVDPGGWKIGIRTLSSLDILLAYFLLRWRHDYVRKIMSTLSPIAFAVVPTFSWLHQILRDEMGEKVWERGHTEKK